MHRHWFEFIVPQDLRVALPCVLVVWAALALMFTYLLGAFDAVRTPESASGLGTGLFFASTLVYGVLAGAWVVRRCEQLVGELRLDCDAATRERFRRRITGITTAGGQKVLLVSLVAGFAHNAVLQGGVQQVFADLAQSTIALGVTLGTMLAWLVITHVVMAFIANARTFAEIGKDHLAIDLLHPDQHSLLGRAALAPTLGLLGTQVLYPLLWLGGEINMVAVLPGFLVTLVALIYLFIRTTLPLHRRLASAKAELIEQVNARIEAQREGDTNMVVGNPALVELQALLDHRAYLQACPEWPFKLTTIVKWSLYLLIPPLTWVGAALIENVVDLVLA